MSGSGPLRLNDFNPQCLNLPREIFLQMASYLPAYQFVGKNPLQAVCKNWNELLSSTALQNKKLRQQVLKSCKTSEDVLALLGDNTLFNQLRLEEVIKLIALHPACAIKLVDALIVSPPTCAIESFDAKFLLQKGGFSLYTYNAKMKFFKILGSQHLNVASYILEKKEFGPLEKRALTKELGCFHLEIAREGSRSSILLDYANAHEEIASNLIQQPNVWQSLTVTDLNRIAHHKKFAKLIFNNIECRQKYLQEDPNEDGFLGTLASYDKDIANELLDKNEYKERLNSTDLINMAEHEEIATRIFASPELCVKLNTNLMDIGIMHESLALKVIEKIDEQDNLSAEHLVNIGKEHSSVAAIILKTPKYNKLLNTEELTELVEPHREISSSMLLSPEWSISLSDEQKYRLKFGRQSLEVRLTDTHISLEWDDFLIGEYQDLKSKFVNNENVMRDQNFRDMCIELVKGIVNESLQKQKKDNSSKNILFRKG